MIVLKSGDLIEDDDGMKFVFLGVEQDNFYATFPFYFETLESADINLE